MADAAKRVTWLHLSDWHQKGKDFDRKVVRDALIEDIRNRKNIDPALAQVDFVIFSGDLAHHGRKEEYQTAREVLLDPVLAAVGLEPERLFMVPGNHDLDRDYAKRMLPPDLQEPIKNTDKVSEWLTDDESREVVLKPFRNYMEFVATYTGQLDPAYGARMGLDLPAGRVHLLGLNTAWMCGRNKKGDAVEDQLHLCLGEPQIHDGLEWLRAGEIRIIVQHHPFEWLAPFDQNQVKRRIKTGTDFLLWGHEHSPSLELVQGPGGNCVIIPAGASYERRRSDSSLYANAYNFTSLDLDQDQGRVFFRRWGETRTQWIQDEETINSGHYGFPLPQRISSGRAEASNLRQKSATAQAGQRYRDILLKSCDIIDLANLPGQDRLLVQRQLDLRRLFVPLHVRVEPSPDDAKAWKVIEARRTARLSSQEEEEEKNRVAVGSRLGAAKRLIILGDPGGGKTTLTRWIATAYLLKLKQDPDHSQFPEVSTLPDECWLPILIRCRDLDKEGCIDTLDSMLSQSLRKAELLSEDSAAVLAYLHDEIRHKRALLIIDGLDEVADARKRADLCRQLEQIATTHEHLPIIATSRIVGYREMGQRLGRDFEHLTLCDLSPEEKDSFAERWCALTQPTEAAAAAQDLIADIRGNERIQRLTGNPMLLTTMALVKRSIGRLPQKRAELYVEAVKALLNWRNDKGERLEADEALPQLHYVAYAMCDRGVQTLRRDQLLDLIAEMRMAYPNIHDATRHPPAQFIDLLESRTGILIQSGHVRYQGEEVPLYEFRHLTFQEFLAAQALVKRTHPGYADGQTLAERVGTLAGRVPMARPFSHHQEREGESWREVLRLCLTLCDPADVDPTLYAILDSPQDDEHSARARLAAQCLTDEPNASDDAGRMVLVTFFNAPVSELRRWLFHISISGQLAATRWKEAWASHLLDRFLSGTSVDRNTAAWLLQDVYAYELHSESDPAAWIARQRTKLAGDVRQRVAAALALAQVTERSKIDLPQDLGHPLVALLNQDDPTDFAVLWALTRLSKTPAEIPVEPLLSLICNPDTPLDTLNLACEFFGQRPDPRAVPELIRSARSLDEGVRRAAVAALGMASGVEGRYGASFSLGR